MELPESGKLNIACLTSVFSNITNSYKYYWFLSILDSIKEKNSSTIKQTDLALRMVANVWYPLDYFKLSFGKSDGFKKIVTYVSDKMLVDHSINSPTVFNQINSSLSQEELKVVYAYVEERTRYVPYRFVRPFLSDFITVAEDHQIKGQVIEVSNCLYSTCPEQVMYRFIDDSIQINDVWFEYLQIHQGILRGFIYWHLLKFLQKNNPTVVGLPDKLFKRSNRDFKLVEPFWKTYLEAHPDLTCIYSGQLITKQNISMDHFLPWSYVVHDQVWNIIPIPKSVNSAKNNTLPSKELYFDNYARLQFDAFQFHAERGNNKSLEDYSALFGQSVSVIQDKPFQWFKESLERMFSIQLQTARNLGFSYPFEFKRTQ